MGQGEKWSSEWRLDKSDGGKKKIKTKRGYGRKRGRETSENVNFKLIGNNANGILGKKESFLNLIKNEKPHCFMLQETKLRRKGQLKVDGYQIFDTVRDNKGGGGLAIGIQNSKF